MMTDVLVVNQHGDNRGDEAAMRGMVAALHARIPDLRVTVLHQFSAADSKIDLPEVEYLPLRIPVLEAVRLSAWAALRRFGWSADFILGPAGRRTVEAYRRAAVVVSAPGGPYFGDLYLNHEVVHWFYVWMARIHGVPLALYQPSAGPFGNRVMNLLRRRGYRWFDVVAVREAISADHVEKLTKRRPHIGSDSALHDDVAPADLRDWAERLGFDPLLPIVTATFRDPGSESRMAHDQAIVEALLKASADRCVVLLPQLHGPRHRDHPYLVRLAQDARSRGARVVVAPETLSSDDQRSLVAASDVVIAGRYHPLVFAAAAGVPALVIPYEHKARGFAHAAGLDRYVVEIEELKGSVLVDRFGELVGNLDGARAEMRRRVPELRDAASSTADLVVSVLDNRLEVR